jgi:hypothetical protein
MALAQSAESVAYQKEMNRRKMDTFKVYNPTDQDFPVIWDSSEIHLVPAKSEKVVPRYIHDAYLKHMGDKLLLQKSKAEMDKLLKEKFIPHHEREMIEIRVDNEPLRLEIYKRLSRGKVADYGVDTAYVGTLDKPVDNKPLEERLLAELEVTEGGNSEPSMEEVDLQVKKNEALKGVAK